MTPIGEFDIRRCPDGRAHVWGPERRYTAASGPMEGSWLAAECGNCSVFSLRSVEEPGGSVAALLGALEAKGCEPHAAA